MTANFLPSPTPGLPQIAVTELEAAAMMGVSAKTMQRWRLGGAIKYFRSSAGGKVLYRVTELQRFALAMEAQ